MGSLSRAFGVLFFTFCAASGAGEVRGKLDVFTYIGTWQIEAYTTGSSCISVGGGGDMFSATLHLFRPEPGQVFGLSQGHTGKTEVVWVGKQAGRTVFLRTWEDSAESAACPACPAGMTADGGGRIEFHADGLDENPVVGIRVHRQTDCRNSQNETRAQCFTVMNGTAYRLAGDNEP